MTFIIVFLAIIQSFTTSLGVGASTLAILNFFGAIADGTIDETERRMMGIVYVVLRIAMISILVTSVALISIEYIANESGALTAYIIAQLIALAVLFINAILMTLRIMPSTFGPALQAGSWYTLGLLTALLPLGLTDFTLTQFLLGYITWLVLAIAIVNGCMSVMKARLKASKERA